MNDEVEAKFSVKCNRCGATTSIGSMIHQGSMRFKDIDIHMQEYGDHPIWIELKCRKCDYKQIKG